MAQPAGILVTGSHRSGTTWVGRTICASPEYAYIHEPFNVDYAPVLQAIRLDKAFTYVCEENEGRHIDWMRRRLRFEVGARAALGAVVERPRSAAFVAAEMIRQMVWRLRRRAPLMKDPLAFFSAQWLAERFDLKPVVMIRNPVAFVGSIKAANWYHSFDDFLSQPLLMRDHLGPFEAEMRDQRSRGGDIVDNAILLWNIIYHVARRYREVQSQWLFVTHEELSRQPLKGFGVIFEYAGVPYTEKLRSAVLSTTDSSNHASRYGLHEIRRDSRSNLDTWRTRLTPDEVATVYERTHEVARCFYSDEQLSSLRFD